MLDKIIRQAQGIINVDKTYKPTEQGTRKLITLKHYILIDKIIVVCIISAGVAGFSLALFHADKTLKNFGSAMAGAVIGAFANRMKDNKINPE